MNLSAPVMAYLVDPLERAGRTFVQQFVVVLMAAGTAGLLVHQNWALAADSAAFAALISILTSVLTFKVPALSPTYDLLLRVVKTFVQSFFGTLVAAQVTSVVHADWRGALAVAVPVALTALLTGLAALGVPGTAGASLLPAGSVPAIEDDVPVEVDAQALALAHDAPTTLASLTVSDPPDAIGKHRV